MKIYLGTDHAGFHLKEYIKAFLEDEGYEIEDCGAHEFDRSDDYPKYIAKVAQKISQNPEERGIIFGGSGQAEAIVANKFPRVRAALFYGPVVAKEAIDIQGSHGEGGYDIVRLSRTHNNTNILSLGARFLSQAEAKKAVTLWLTTDFSGVERHKRRIQEVEDMEKTL